MHAFQPSVAVAIKRGFHVARHAVTSQSGRSRPSLPGWTLLLAKVLVSVGLLAWLIWEVEPSTLLNGLLRVSVTAASVVIGLSVFQNILVGIRWKKILHALGSVLDTYAVLRLTFIGFFFGQILPATVGGDVARVYYAVSAGVPFRHGWTSVLFDRVVALFALLALAAMGLPLLFAVVVEPGLGWSVTAVTVCGLGGLLAFGMAWPRLRGRLGRFRLIAPVVGLANEFHRLLWSRSILVIGAVAVAVHLVSAATIVASASALDVDLPVGAALVLTPPIILVTMLPISLAGWGVREGAMVVGLAQLGIGSDAAIMVSVLFGLGQMASSLPGGVLWLLARPRAVPSQDPAGPGA